MTSVRLEEEADRQLPSDDEIFLDHIAHFVADPQSARAALARAGFAPTPVSIQANPDPAGGVPKPSGTGNVTAMLTRGYIEVLFKTADTALGRELEAARARYGGLHLVAFAVANAHAAHRRLAKHFRMQPLLDMQRPLDTAEGPGIAAFTIARLEHGQMPEGRIQILTHRTEETVWQKRWLDHPNGARALVSVTIAVADVEEAAARFSRFAGRASRPRDGGQVIALDRGRVELITPNAFERAYPEIAIPSLPFVGACGIRVASLAAAEKALSRGGVDAYRRGDHLVVPFPSELGTGTWIFAE